MPNIFSDFLGRVLSMASSLFADDFPHFFALFFLSIGDICYNLVDRVKLLGVIQPVFNFS